MNINLNKIDTFLKIILVCVSLHLFILLWVCVFSFHFFRGMVGQFSFALIEIFFINFVDKVVQQKKMYTFQKTNSLQFNPLCSRLISKHDF